MSSQDLVAYANSFAMHHFGFQPVLEKKVIGKMGLKGVEGLKTK